MNTLYTHTTPITYYDLDYCGNVKLSALLKIVHIAADKNASEIGIGFATLHPLNISFILQRFSLNISQMPKYGDTVTIRTWPADITRGTFVRKGDMYSNSGKKIMEWASLWILFDLNARKIIKPSALPVEVPAIGDEGVGIEPQKIILPQDLGRTHHSYLHTVRYSDVDTNIHMNNSVYGDLVGNVLYSNTDTTINLQQVNINYLAETRMGEEISVNAYSVDNCNYIIGETSGRRAFTAMVK